ncbi:MAG: cyclic nucleotide-binding domain-containing protein [Desulfobacteraceae bacterium]|jgi:CRP-like cAMP-binding protein
MKNEKTCQVLQNSRFFCNLADESIEKVAQMCQEVAFDTGESVFKQGDYGEHLYIIVEGQVHLERSMNMGNRKGRVLIDSLGKGRAFGCWSSLLGEAHVLMSTATCQRPTTLLKIKGRDLRQTMTQSITFGFDVMERLCLLLRDRIEAAYGAMDRI